ncbi:hypothetical protein [Scytonema sp. NUACC26]|uniref:hypothetical protein n=1 Tax=Scytonema sp. NUACC26 TaxID=3140176 RepID=UPI0034DBBAD0
MSTTSKVIPKFYLPKEHPEDMKLLVEGLVTNNGQPLKSAVSWLQEKLTVHEGRTTGKTMSATTIKNYLAGFYVLDLFKADNILYSESQPLERASVPSKARIEVIGSLKLILNFQSIETFNESLTRICLQYSKIVRDYNSDRRVLQAKFELEDKPKPTKLQYLLIKHCDYSYVGHPGVGYLDMFYQDKVQIDNSLKLLQFIAENYRDVAQRNLGLIPLDKIFNHLKEVTDYREEDFKKYLTQLQLTNRIELRTTKSQLAQNMGIDLVDIRGIQYGFVKIVEPAIAI